jgi:hypothetical protein
MSAKILKKLRFSDVVYAIGSTPKSVRLWLQRGLVEINTPKSDSGGWTEYNFHDIAILALVRSLVDFGVDVRSSSAISNEILSDHFFPMPDALTWERPGAAAGFWSNRRLFIYRRAWRAGNESRRRSGKAICAGAPTLLGRSLTEAIDPRDADFHADTPSGISMLRKEIEPASVYLSIDVASVLLTAFDRAVESATEGADEDDDE